MREYECDNIHRLVCHMDVTCDHHVTGDTKQCTSHILFVAMCGTSTCSDSIHVIYAENASALKVDLIRESQTTNRPGFDPVLTKKQQSMNRQCTDISILANESIFIIQSDFRIQSDVDTATGIEIPR